MKLFEKMPYLENEKVILHRMEQADAQALSALANDPAVYTYLPTFLFEQKYADACEVIRRMHDECFLTKESILLGVYLKSDPSKLVGIGEIYAYDAAKNKASLGCRLSQEVWHRGIAKEVLSLLIEYLTGEIKIRTITAHVMTHNLASGKVAEKAGLKKTFAGIWEDWGREGPVLVDKYVLKNS